MAALEQVNPHPECRECAAGFAQLRLYTAGWRCWQHGTVRVGGPAGLPALAERELDRRAEAEAVVLRASAAPASDAERKLATDVLATIRKWSHGWSQCVTAGEKALCAATMHDLIQTVFDFDEPRPAPVDGVTGE